MRFRHAVTVIAGALTCFAHGTNYSESLTLRTLSDGRVAALFEFVTYFDLPASAVELHHTLTSPALLPPLVRNGVSELTVYSSVGDWGTRTDGIGPLASTLGGGGGEIRGWLKSGENAAARWSAVVHAFGGLFCADLSNDVDESVNTFGEIFPATVIDSDLSHFRLAQPHLSLCTENLSPFISLLPSKGLSGLAALLSPKVFGWSHQAEMFHIVLPTPSSTGVSIGSWEGIIDVMQVQPHKSSTTRVFSLASVFGRAVPSAYPAAGKSVIRLLAEQAAKVEPAPSVAAVALEGGERHHFFEWESAAIQGCDMTFTWEDGVGNSSRHEEPRVNFISRSVAHRGASDGLFRIVIDNRGPARRAIYTEVWPWWVKGWISELSVVAMGKPEDDLLRSVSYHPSVPPTSSMSTLHVELDIPPDNTFTITVPFSKLTLAYKEHRPDAERGRELAPSLLTLHNVAGDECALITGAATVVANEPAHRRPMHDSRSHIYANRLLLDVPTPDFSMPYNVIIMSSTVMAVFFGSVHGRLTRRWGWTLGQTSCRV